MTNEKIEEQLDKEIDKVIEESLKKDVTQADKIDESVETHLQEMGFLWDRVNTKLRTDNVCFYTKKPLDKDEDGKVKLRVLEINSTDPGVVAFCSVSEESYNELQKKQEDKEKEEQKK